MFCVCHAFLSVHCSLVVTFYLLTLLHVMFSSVFVTFSCGVLGYVWYLVELILIFAFLLTFFGREYRVKVLIENVGFSLSIRMEFIILF